MRLYENHDFYILACLIQYCLVNQFFFSVCHESSHLIDLVDILSICFNSFVLSKTFKSFVALTCSFSCSSKPYPKGE